MAILEFAKISSLVSNHRVKESGKEKNEAGLGQPSAGGNTADCAVF